MLADLDKDTAEVTEIVRDRIGSCRERGLDHAFRTVGRELGMTPRRARSFWLKQVRTITTNEWRRVLGNASAWLERDTARLEARNAALRARLSSGAGLKSNTRGYEPAPGWDGIERRGVGAPAGVRADAMLRSVS